MERCRWWQRREVLIWLRHDDTSNGVYRQRRTTFSVG